MFSVNTTNHAPASLMGCIPLRGVHYILPWDLGTVRSFLKTRQVSAADFDQDTPGIHRFIRDLLILAAKEVLDGDQDRSIRSLVRELLDGKSA